MISHRLVVQVSSALPDAEDRQKLSVFIAETVFHETYFEAPAPPLNLTLFAARRPFMPASGILSGSPTPTNFSFNFSLSIDRPIFNAHSDLYPPPTPLLLGQGPSARQSRYRPLRLLIERKTKIFTAFKPERRRSATPLGRRDSAAEHGHESDGRAKEGEEEAAGGSYGLEEDGKEDAGAEGRRAANKTLARVEAMARGARRRETREGGKRDAVRPYCTD